MSSNQCIRPTGPIEEMIRTVHDQRIILDADLARLYGVSTKRLNEQVKRNRKRFPAHFMFSLTAAEKAEVVANCDHLQRLKFSPVLPNAFTERGAIMAATVLNSDRAIQVSIYVVEAFVRLRDLLTRTQSLTSKLAALEKELKERLDVHEVAIVDILRRLMDIIELPALPEPPKTLIRFQVKEARAVYHTRRDKMRPHAPSNAVTKVASKPSPDKGAA